MPPTQSEISELYDRYAHVLFLRARSILGNDEEAQDAVQDTFAKVIHHWEGFRQDSSPLTWMYKISTNLCLNRVRNRKGRAAKHDANREDIVGDDATWMRPPGEAERIRALLADMDEETQKVVLHIYFDDMTREETAQLVGLSVPTVRKRLNTFLKHARRAFGVQVVADAVVVMLILWGLP